MSSSCPFAPNARKSIDVLDLLRSLDSRVKNFQRLLMADKMSLRWRRAPPMRGFPVNRLRHDEFSISAFSLTFRNLVDSINPHKD